MPEPDPQRFARPSTPRARRANAAALDDRTLLAAMRAGDEHAWAEFDARFRPALAVYARRVQLTPGLTDADVVDALVDELLGEEGSRLTAANAPEVPALAAYLLRAARHRLYNLRRGAARRLRRYETAASSDVGESTGEYVVSAVCSEDALRESRGPEHGSVVREQPDGGVEPESPESEDASGAVARLATALRALTTPDEQQLLGWVAQRVPHRTIAAWLQVSYDAAAKRVWRLCRRLRAAAVQYVDAATPEEREQLARFLRRSGALPPLAAPPSPPAAGPHVVGVAARMNTIPVDDHD